MREGLRRHVQELRRTVAATAICLGSVASLVAGCQSVPDAICVVTTLSSNGVPPHFTTSLPAFDMFESSPTTAHLDILSAD